MKERKFNVNVGQNYRTQDNLSNIWNMQNKAFEIYRDYLVHWVERRQEGAKATLDTTQKLFTCNGEPQNVMDIYSDYLTHTLERWVDDFGEYAQCQNHATKLWHDRMQGYQESSIEEKSRLKDSLSPKDSIPIGPESS